MKTRKFAGLVLAALITVSTTLFAQVPTVIYYQGNLADPTSGNPVDRTVAMQFKLYTASASGNSLWEETHSSVKVEKGLFNVLLGSRTSFPKDIFSDPKYLEIVIGSEILQPRQRIGSAPYAISSGIALGQIALSNSLSDIKRHTASFNTTSTVTLVNEVGPIALLSGAIHGSYTNWSISITVDAVTTTLTPQRYDDHAGGANGFVQLPPIMANSNLKIEIIQSSGRYVSGYAWTKKF